MDTWHQAFLLSNLIQLLLCTPRMLKTSMPIYITFSYILGVLCDSIWHFEKEENNFFINIGSLFYLIGTLPFVYVFFWRGGGGWGVKGLMALLYLVNIYTFGDPNETNVPFFIERHFANHVGSTLFYYIAVKKEYQTSQLKIE